MVIRTEIWPSVYAGYPTLLTYQRLGSALSIATDRLRTWCACMIRIRFPYVKYKR